MERLRFGTRARRRARRRARLRRAVLVAWIGSLGGALLGMPAGVELLGMMQQEGGESGAEMSGGLVSIPQVRGDAFASSPAPRPAPVPKEPKRKRAERNQPQPAPAPQVTAEPEPVPDGSIEGAILAAAAEFSLSGDYLLSVARCESDLDPNAFSPVGYHGLFQFDLETWAAYGYGSIYEPVAQARTAARLLAAGHSSRWPNCA